MVNTEEPGDHAAAAAIISPKIGLNLHYPCDSQPCHLDLLVSQEGLGSRCVTLRTCNRKFKYIAADRNGRHQMSCRDRLPRELIDTRILR